MCPALLDVAGGLREQALLIQIGHLGCRFGSGETANTLQSASALFVCLSDSLLTIRIVACVCPVCAGCVLYELCTLKHAFDAHNLLGLVWKIVSENYPPIPEHYSKDLKDLVGAMLAKDPQQRPSIDMILELQFIRARLHSQIKAKMTLKTNKAGGAAATTAGQASTGNSPTKPTTARTVAQTTRPATTSAAGTVASSPSNIAASSTLPSQQPSAAAVRTPSASVSSSGVQQGAGPSTSPTPHSGPNGTMRAPRPTLDVGDRNHSPQGSPTPTASNVAVGASNGQRSFSANRNGASTPSANNNPLASPSAVGSSRTSSASSSAYPSPHDASGHAAAPLMSPSEQLLQRKQALADQRQAELVAFQTSQVRGMSGSSASQSRAGEYRGGTSGRPGTSQPQQLPSYQAAFNDEPAQPARQRSAGATRTQQQGGYSGNDGSYSGRGVGTPTKPGADYYSYPAVPNTPSGGGGGNDDRPIKSSGSYFRPASGTGGGAPIMSPTAMQQARAANMAHSSSPPSSNNARGGSNNGRYGFSREDIDSELHLQDFDRPSSGSHHSHSHSGAAAASVRPTSVSSSRVTRVREEDDDDDAHSSGLGPLRGEDESYSDDDFENYEGDEEDAAIAVLEKTYTSHHLSRSPFEGGVSGSASSFASSSNAGGQVSGSYHGSTASTNTSFGTSASGFSSSASSASSQARSGPSSAGGARPISGSGSQQQGASSAPSMGSKQEAIKAMCLRSMSSSEFDEVCAFIRSRSSPSKGSGSGLSKEELASKFGSINQKVIFMVEQYVFLSEILEQHGSGATGTGSTANTSTAAGKKPQSQPNQQLQPSSSPVSSSRLNKPGSAGSSSAKPAASPSAGTTTAAKPTSAGSKKPAASPPPTSATSASAASKPKPPSSATTRTVVPPVAGAKKK